MPARTIAGCDPGSMPGKAGTVYRRWESLPRAQDAVPDGADVDPSWAGTTWGTSDQFRYVWQTLAE